MEMPLLKFIPKFRSKNMPRKAKLLTLAFCTSLVGGSAVAGNSANEQGKVVVKLDRIQNTSTGDPGPIFQELQRPQIYLWVVLFRIGGQDYYVDNQFNILGSPSIYPFQSNRDTVNGGHEIPPGQIVTLYNPTLQIPIGVGPLM
jgi:hypothetical protein